MRIASWRWGGRDHVGTVSPCGREATPLAVADPARGALPVIEALARGEPLPPPAGARLPVDAIELRAPLPRPLRNLWCVGRNYHAHAAELAESVFRASLPVEHAWPIVFTKVPECVVGPRDDVRLPGPSISSQIDYESELAVVIGRDRADVESAAPAPAGDPHCSCLGCVSWSSQWLRDRSEIEGSVWDLRLKS